MQEKTRNNGLSLMLISLFLITSCSTKKKTYFHRKYHDVTAKYNGYFNGKESLKYGIKKLEESHKDDYLNILPVFKHSNISMSKTHHSYMHKSIQKGSVVIQNHSINVKNLVTHKFSIKDSKEAFECAIKNNNSIKVMIPGA